MNTRIALSGLSIFAALSLMTGAAFAFFTDSGQSTGNTFGTGTFDLKLSDNNQTALDNVDTTWSGTDMAPGGAIISATLNLKNTGTVAGDHVHIKAANTLTDNGTVESGGSMAKHLKITSITYDGNPVVVPDLNANGYPDLDDLAAAPLDGVKLGSLTNLSTDHPLVMGVQLASDADNTYQGDQVVTVLTATLDQDASQTP